MDRSWGSSVSIVTRFGLKDRNSICGGDKNVSRRHLGWTGPEIASSSVYAAALSPVREAYHSPPPKDSFVHASSWQGTYVGELHPSFYTDWNKYIAQTSPRMLSVREDSVSYGLKTCRLSCVRYHITRLYCSFFSSSSSVITITCDVCPSVTQHKPWSA